MLETRARTPAPLAREIGAGTPAELAAATLPLLRIGTGTGR